MPPWTPTYAATDVRPIVGNLKAFFEANQVDALAWASPARELAPLTIYDSAESRIKDDYPHMGLVGRGVRIAREGDLLRRVTHQLVWELEVTAKHAADNRTETLTQLRKDVDNYAYAVESMHLNCPDATILAGIGQGTMETLDVAGSDPVEVAVSDTESLYNVQLTVVLTLIQGMFA